MVISDKELLPKAIWDKYGANGLRYLDKRVVESVRYLREVVGKPFYLNTDTQDEMTIRLPGHKNYKQFSEHAWGRAIDFQCPDVDSLTIQKLITKDVVVSTKLKQLGLTAIEDGTISWTHISCANFNGWGFNQINGIYLIPEPK